MVALDPIVLVPSGDVPDGSVRPAAGVQFANDPAVSVRLVRNDRERLTEPSGFAGLANEGSSEREKAFARESDALSAARREMPWLRIDKEHHFDWATGELSPGDLFGGRGQLIVYHFMFGPDRDEGCPSCSFWTDNFDGTDIYLAHRDTTLVAISKAPLSKLQAQRRRMGWRFSCLSAARTDFNEDFGVTFTPEQIERGEVLYY